MQLRTAFDDWTDRSNGRARGRRNQDKLPQCDFLSPRFFENRLIGLAAARMLL